jgi:hypothetical protein
MALHRGRGRKAELSRIVQLWGKNWTLSNGERLSGFLAWAVRIGILTYEQ